MPESEPCSHRQGFSTALAGNTLLLSYFLGKGERAAALVQTIGAVSNFVMLTQVPACRNLLSILLTKPWLPCHACRQVGVEPGLS